ncbi:hypothetical protein [Bradyrhizobium sp. USDA 4449]
MGRIVSDVNRKRISDQSGNVRFPDSRNGQLALSLLGMMTPQDYGELAAKYERLAEAARDQYSRYQLEMLAKSYMVLAKSTAVLDRSTKALEAIEKAMKK